MLFGKRTLIGCLALPLVLGISAPLVAQTEVTPAPCSFTRDDVVAGIEAGLTEDEIAAQFAGCKATADDVQAASPLRTAAAGLNIISNTGITFWEAIEACGYHPQREELDCSIDVRQRFGFGGPPAIGLGTNEWVIFCVDFGFGLVPVNTNAVHVHDEPFGVQPPWSYGVVVQSNPALTALINNGRTLRARAILSWFFVPTGCGFIPPFGNQADFRIKLDP